MISVIIPTHNRAALLAEAIRSVQAQSSADYEIIVADDGSTDDTPQVAAQFGRAVNYLRLPHRGQPAATRNAGLRAAQGEFIAFLDSDDFFLPDKFAQQLPLLQAKPEVGLVYSDGIYFRDDPACPIGRVLDGLPTPAGDVFADLLRANFLAPPVVLIRRASLDAIGTFDEQPDFFAVEDYDLWLRLAARFPFAYVPGSVAAIRRHSQGISRDLITLRERILRVLAKMAILYPDLMRQHRGAQHEALARNYASLAVLRVRQRQIVHGVGDGLIAVTHFLRTPGFGRRQLAAWWKRRHRRQAVRQ